MRTLMTAMALAVFAGGSISVTARAAETATVKIEVVGLRNQKGSVRLALWNSKDGFPKDSEKAARRFRLPIVDGKASLVVDGLVAGDWAIAAFHDENDNGVFDLGLFGIPKEGMACSRDARNRFGPPSFDQAKIPLRAGEQTLTLRVVYP